MHRGNPEFRFKGPVECGVFWKADAKADLLHGKSLCNQILGFRQAALRNTSVKADAHFLVKKMSQRALTDMEMARCACDREFVTQIALNIFKNCLEKVALGADGHGVQLLAGSCDMYKQLGSIAAKTDLPTGSLCFCFFDTPDKIPLQIFPLCTGSSQQGSFPKIQDVRICVVQCFRKRCAEPENIALVRNFKMFGKEGAVNDTGRNNKDIPGLNRISADSKQVFQISLDT